EHPLAKAVLAAVAGIALPPAERVQAQIGRGVTGVVEGRKVAIGSRELMRELGVALAEVEPALEGIEQQARTAVVVAVDGRALGALGIADPVRSEAAAAIELLAEQGVQTEMLTGDVAAVARAVAEKLGIPNFHASVKP